jgi:hypothetical protein
MKSVKIFGKSVPLLAIVMVSMLVIGASAYAFVGVASASSTLTLRYYTGINGGGDPVTGLSVYVKTSGGADVTSKGGVSGTTSFSLEDGNYNVVSVKGASSRIDPVVVSGATTVDIQCGKLIVNYNTNNDGTDISHGSGTDVTGVSVYVKWAANMGDVASAGGVSGSTSFALLAGDSAYKVVSVKGASSRTDGPYTVASTQTADIPVARFRVVVVKSDFTAQTGVSVYVKTSGGGDVASAGGVSGSVDFSLLQSKDGPGPYRFIAIKGSTAQADQSANEVPPAGLSGVILMIP